MHNWKKITIKEGIILKKLVSLMMSFMLATTFITPTVTKAETNANLNTLSLQSEKINLTSRKIEITKDWKFNLGAVSGAEAISFDDSAWRSLNLPHDWSIELDFNRNSASTHEGGFLDGGTGWYRKTFTVDEAMKGKKVSIDFDGVYMESSVYVNGTKVGENQNGYTPFSYDISSNLKFNGEQNVIAVKVVNTQPSSRWYSGSGIYRNVFLTVTNPVHVDRYGTFVTTPTIETDLVNNNVNVNIKTKVKNEGIGQAEATIKSKVVSTTGEVVAQTQSNENIASAAVKEITHNVVVNNPKLWSIYNSNMYNVVTEVIIGGATVDTYNTPFGFRYFKFDANTGFSINGQYTKLNGVCMHHDLGALGSAVNYDAISRQVKMLKDMGVNAIRLTHNPTSPEFIAVCEKEGILLIEESFDCWAQAKKTYDYARFFNQYAKRDIQEMVNRGKNSPAIIMWSIGNEIYDTDTVNGVTIARNLVNWVKEIDTTRPTTIGEDKYRGSKTEGAANWNVNRDAVMATVDVAGYNYSENVYDVHHAAKPTLKMYGSEISSAVRSRGIYLDPSNPNISDSANLQTSSYDNSVVGWGRSAEDSTKRDRDRQFSAGQFIWTGFDYIGEPTPFYNSYPAKSSYFGAIDTAGLPKDIFYFYQSQWTDKPMVHLLPHWNWDNGKTVSVWAYSNADTVELFLNGKSLGERKFDKKTTNYGKPYLETTDGKLHLTWDVPFEAGTLKAVAKKDGVVVAEDIIKTASSPAKVKLTPDKQVIDASGKALSFVTVDIVDANGVVVPTANNLVEFEVTGGTLVGVDNGNASSVERYKDTKRKAFSGKAMAIIQSTEATGEITVKAKSQGLDSASTIIYSVKASETNKDQIVGYDQVTFNVNKGEIPNLPTQINAIYGDNSKKAVSVTWDNIDNSIYNNIGIVTINGTVEGTSVKAKAVITVRDIIGIKPVSNVTIIGVAPTLPSEVWMIYSDGKEEKTSVTWNSIDPSKYATAGNFTVEGTVSGTTKFKAEARIRVAASTVKENIAKATSSAKGFAIASQTGAGDQAAHLNDGVISYNNSPKNRWTNWPATSSDWVGIQWDKPQAVDNMNLYVYGDSGCEAPQSLVVEYYDGTTWKPVSNAVVSPILAVNNSKSTITFNKVTTNKIRVNMTPKSGKSLALTEIEVMGEVVVKNNDANLSLILLGSTPLSGFASDKTIYDVVLEYGEAIPSIKAITTNNGVETILPPTTIPGEAKITVTSESGINQKTYTIRFTQKAPSLSNVVISTDSLNIKEDDLVNLDIKSRLLDNSLVDNKNTTIEYVSSDRSIVDIRDGKLAGLGEGQAEVYVNVTYDGKKVTSNKLVINVEKSNEAKIIQSIKVVNIVTDKGIKPSLPEKVMAEYNVGLPREKTVTWDTVSEDLYSQIGTFKIYGTIEGSLIKAVANIEVKGEVGISNISAVTLINEEPTLPGEVTIYYSDNTEVKAAVTWDTISKEQYSAIGEFTIYGTVKGTNLKPSAKIRVSNESTKGLNISRFQNGYDYPRIASSYSNEPPADSASLDRLAHLNNDIISFNDSPHDRWTNWKRTPDTTGWVSVAFGRTGPQEYYVNEMTVNYFTDSGVSLPASATVQYKKDGNWVDVTSQTVTNGTNANTRIYKFDKIKTAEVRLFMNAVSGKSLGITELQVYKDDVVKNTNSKAEEIKLDGDLLTGFSKDTFKYKVNVEGDKLPVITAKAEDKASVVILQGIQGKLAKVIVTGEDGIATNTYEIEFVKNVTVSKVELEQELQLANSKKTGNYTTTTLKLLNDAIKYATTIKENTLSTQYEVNSAVLLLKQAISNLVENTPIEVSADLNKDGVVDIKDLSLVSKYYGTNKPEYDLNKDNIIDDYEINYIMDKILD